MSVGLVNKRSLYLLLYKWTSEKSKYEAREKVRKEGEEVRNGNGERIVKLCIQNDLVITNTNFNIH